MIDIKVRNIYVLIRIKLISYGDIHFDNFFFRFDIMILFFTIPTLKFISSNILYSFYKCSLVNDKVIIYIK